MVRLWGRLAWCDVRHRYRRTVLGPWWIALGTGLTVALVGTLYGGLFGRPLAEHLPYVAAGLVIWNLLAGFVTDGCRAFLDARGIVRQVAVPLSLHVYRMVWRNVLTFGHNAALLLAAGALFGLLPDATGLLALAGLAAVCANGAWAGLVLGVVTARFRDMQPLADNLMRLAFLATPIVWTPALLPERAWVAAWNPLHHLMEVVRAPLLGEPPPLTSWLVAGAMAASGWLAAVVLYARCRPHIAYWV